jgi:PAS domain S-box-containing protein
MDQPQVPTSQLLPRRWLNGIITVIVVIVGAWWLILGDWVIDQSLQPPASLPTWRYVGHGVVLTITAVLLYRLLARRGRPDPVRCSSCVAYHSFSASADGMFINAPDGRFLEANDAGCRMLGLDRDELLGMTIADVVLPEGIDGDSLWVDTADDKLPRVTHREIRRKDGGTLSVEVAAQLLPDGTVLGAVRDLTERRRIESRLAEQTRRFDTMLDKSARHGLPVPQ